MDEMTLFEHRFEDRVRGFARAGVGPVDSAAVAHAVALSHPRGLSTRPAVRWLGLPLDRRAWVIALTVGLLMLLTTVSAFVGGGRPAVVESNPTVSPSPSSSPSSSPSPTPIPRASGGITPKEGATAVTLADGRMLIVGGASVTEGVGSMLASAEIYDPATGQYTATGSMAEPRYAPLAAVFHDGRVLVAGGWSEVAELASAELFDPTTGTFTAVGSMPFARGSCHCGISFQVMIRPTMTVLTDGRAMIVGGRPLSAKGEPLTSDAGGGADIFDLGTGRFASSAPIPCDASRGTVTGLLDGTALVTCRARDAEGSTPADWQPRAFIYDPASDTFAPTGAPSSDVSGTATLQSDGRVLLTGPGIRGSTSPAELYDPTTRLFARVGEPTVPAP